MEYKLRVDSDTQLQMTTVYQRDGRKPKSNKHKREAKRTFGVVVKGFMITSVLLTSLISGGTLKALANENNDQAIDDLKPVAQQEVNAFQDEQAMISNLKMAVKFLDVGLKQGQASVQMYTKVLERIGHIEGKLAVDGINDTDSLIDNVNILDAVVKQDTDVELTGEILAKRESTIQAVHDLQTKLGYTSSIEDSYTPNKNEEVELELGTSNSKVIQTEAVANESVPTQATTVSNTIQGHQYFNLKYNGKTQTSKGVALYKSSTAYLSLYQFNQALGGKLSGSNNVWTLKVGNNTLKYTVGSSVYYVNGVKQTSTKGKVTTVGGNVYLTSDMANVLNYKVTANTKDKLITIESPVQQTVPIALTVKGKAITGGVVKDGISYLPIRAVYETMGAKISTAKTGFVQVTKDGISHEYKRESTSATINGKAITLTGKTITLNGNTMIDASSVSGVFNSKVEITNGGKKVTITEVALKVASVTVAGKHIEGKVTSKTTIAPIKDVFENMGFKVVTQGNYISVTKGTDVLLFKKDSDMFTVNGKTKYLFDNTQLEGTSYFVDVVGLDGVLGISTSVSNTGQSVTMQLMETGNGNGNAEVGVEIGEPVEAIAKPVENKPKEEATQNQTQEQLQAIATNLWKNDSFMFAKTSPQKVNGIMTQYNGHTYAVKSQTEYDAVIKEVKRLIEKSYALDKQYGNDTKFINQVSYLWSTGFQAKDRTSNSMGWRVKEFYDNGHKFEDAVRLYQAKQINSAVMGVGAETVHAGDARSYTLESAYQHLFGGITDCDSEAQALLVAYDIMGFSASIYGTVNEHADLFVKFDGATYNASGVLAPYSFKETPNGVYVTSWTQQKFTSGK